MSLVGAWTVPDQAADDLIDPERDQCTDTAAQRGDLPTPFTSWGGEQPQKDNGEPVDDDAERFERVGRMREPLVIERELIDGVEDPVVYRLRW
jgi:hypothetical protein